MASLFSRIQAAQALIIAGVILMLGGCSASGHEGFAIYLTKNDIPPSQMPALSHVDLAEQPVIALGDIISYDASTHEITLTSNAFDRIAGLEVPVRGRSFIVCVDKQPIYWGAFWTPISSLSFDGVTIWKPLGAQDPKVIKLELGYPTFNFYHGEDPRNNAVIMESLRQAGKLVDIPPAEAVGKLPHSMKGYELYSWPKDDEWHFTLITGTNRNKTPEEITSLENIVSQEGWVHIRVLGLDAIRSVLARLPQDEEVFWLSIPHSGQILQDVVFQLPPQPTVDAVKEYAGQLGLNLTVPQP